MDNKKSKIIWWLTLISAMIAAALSVMTSSCSSSKGLTLQADSIKTLNVHYSDSTSLTKPW